MKSIFGLVALLASTAAIAVPSVAQNKSLLHTFTQFMHYGPCTYKGCQWDIPWAPPSIFTPPDNMNTDNWVEVAKSYGATQICLTVRHVDGFALWPTTSNNYSVASSPWRGGKGDVVLDFVTSVRKYGLSPCFYIILGFNVWANKTGVSGPAYLEQQKTVLTELLTNYGEIDRLWLDNYALDGAVYQPVTHEGFVCPGNVFDTTLCPAWGILMGLAKSISPNTAIFPGPDGCLVNAESAGGTYPVYHATTTPQGAYGCAGDVSRPDNGPIFTLPESDFSILNPGDNWFWDAKDPYLKAADITAQVDAKLGQGANLIFNVPPNSSGVIPAEYVRELLAFAAARNATYARPAALLSSPKAAICSELSFIVPVTNGASFDHIVIEEDLGAGQVIGGYSLEVQMTTGGPWTPLTNIHGVTVGSRVQDTLPQPITGAVALRFNCTKDLTPPAPAVFTNALGRCLGIPYNDSFPCWSGAATPGGQVFHLCPLVGAPWACGLPNTSVWSTPDNNAWSPVNLPTAFINIDCNACSVGTHAKLILDISSPLTWDETTQRIRINSCPDMCLTNGIDGGARPSCAGNEPWDDTMVHVDSCTATSTAGWVKTTPIAMDLAHQCPPGSSVADGPLLATVKAFGAFLKVSPST